MKIIEYYVHDVEDPGWEFARVKFGKINLLVGDTATGKTRLLNTIFNLGRFVASKEFKNGHWDIQFEHDGIFYKWMLETEKRDGDNSPGVITREKLIARDGEIEKTIVDRNIDSFYFNNAKLPKLSLKETSISLLQEEEDIAPVYEAFTLILRRRFFHDALSRISEFHAIPTSLIDSIEKENDLRKIFLSDINLSAKLFLLWKYFPNIYKLIIEQYKRFFHFVSEVRMTDISEFKSSIAFPSQVPIFSVRERDSDKWIPITELSSGMQKVLLILTDMYLLPEGGVYIIDEYENSLGINAIDFFPEFILELDKEFQLFMTSHHPYIINDIPPSNWYIFHRDGMDVLIKYGDELSERFGKSKQKAFIQLINDPFFSKGVE